MDMLGDISNPSLVNIMMVIILLLMIIFLHLYSVFKLSYWKRKGIIQLSNTNMLFGNFKNGILLRTSPGYHLGEIYQQAPSEAPYVGFYIFHKPCLLLKDPEIIKQIFVYDFNNFCNRHFAGPQQRDSLGMINLFGIRNPAWRYLRQKITPNFTRRKLRQMVPYMMNTGTPMMLYLNNNVNINEDSKCMDALEVIHKFTADLFANMVLGIKTDSFMNPNSDYMLYWMRFFHSFRRMIALVTVFFIPNVVNVKYGSSIYFNSSLLRKIFWNSVELREKSATKRGDIIDVIIDLKNGKQDPIYRLVGDNLFFQTGTFLGLESSSTAAAFTLMELAKNKKYQDRSRNDIIKAVDVHGWTFEAYSEMKYLDQCINEAIRLHPPVSVLDRDTLQDYQIPNTDICIKKGTPIYISLYGLHRDPRYFKEPELFNPERFGDGTEISDAYLPFGIGPRTCVAHQVTAKQDGAELSGSYKSALVVPPSRALSSTSTSRSSTVRSLPTQLRPSNAWPGLSTQERRRLETL